MLDKCVFSLSHAHPCQACTLAVPRWPQHFPQGGLRGPPPCPLSRLVQRAWASLKGPPDTQGTRVCRPAARAPAASPYRLTVDVTQHGGGVDLVEAGQRVEHVSAAGGVAHAICRELHHRLAWLHHPQLATQTHGGLHWMGEQRGDSQREPSTPASPRLTGPAWDRPPHSTSPAPHSPLTALIFGAATHVLRTAHERLVQLGLLPLGGQRWSAHQGGGGLAPLSGADCHLGPSLCQQLPCSGWGGGWRACWPGGPLAPCELSHSLTRMPGWLPRLHAEELPPSVLSWTSGLSRHSERSLAASAGPLHGWWPRALLCSHTFPPPTPGKRRGRDEGNHEKT